MNPRCPKCGRFMETKIFTVESFTDSNNRKHWGLVKFWVCPNKSLLHGKIRFRKGQQTIPPYHKGLPSGNKGNKGSS